VHLTRSLSADYVTRTRNALSPFRSGDKFWDRFITAHKLVTQIDQHDSFEDQGIIRLFEFISPEYLVFEFTYSDMAEWQAKIDRQKRALAGLVAEQAQAG